MTITLFPDLPVKAKKKRAAREENIQLQICKYLKLQYPDVMFICDTAAGMNLGMKWNGIKKASRSNRGMPDMYIFQPAPGIRFQYTGLALEVKSGKDSIFKKDGTLKTQKRTVRNRKGFVESYDHIAEQASMLGRLRATGWKAEFAEGFSEAKKIIDEYLGK